MTIKDAIKLRESGLIREDIRVDLFTVKPSQLITWVHQDPMLGLEIIRIIKGVESEKFYAEFAGDITEEIDRLSMDISAFYASPIPIEEEDEEEVGYGQKIASKATQPTDPYVDVLTALAVLGSPEYWETKNYGTLMAAYVAKMKHDYNISTHIISWVGMFSGIKSIGYHDIHPIAKKKPVASEKYRSNSEQSAIEKELAGWKKK